MDYTEFCTPPDAEAFLRVARLQMDLADTARAAAAHLVGGQLSRDADDRQYVATSRGRYRLAMQKNSDNRTEARAHAEAGVETVVMSDDDAMTAFFRDHGVRAGLSRWKARVSRALLT